MSETLNYSKRHTIILDALIIDDEKDICFLLNGILRQRNVSTQYVHSLSEARVAMLSEIPDILFLDNHLPDGFGVDFIPYIKAKFPSSKVIMITAHDSQQDRQKAYDKGVDFFLSKPFGRAQVNEIIDQIA